MRRPHHYGAWAAETEDLRLRLKYCWTLYALIRAEHYLVGWNNCQAFGLIPLLSLSPLNATASLSCIIIIVFLNLCKHNNFCQKHTHRNRNGGQWMTSKLDPHHKQHDLVKKGSTQALLKIVTPCSNKGRHNNFITTRKGHFLGSPPEDSAGISHHHTRFLHLGLRFPTPQLPSANPASIMVPLTLGWAGWGLPKAPQTSDQGIVLWRQPGLSARLSGQAARTSCSRMAHHSYWGHATRHSLTN